jgi:hypothetical protein
MDAFKAASDDEDKSAGNNTTPRSVGKLKHSYLENDDKSTLTKRNFTVNKRTSEEAKEKEANKPEKNDSPFTKADEKGKPYKPGKIDSPFTKADKEGKPPPSNATKTQKRGSFVLFKKRRDTNASTSSTGSSRPFRANPINYLKSKARVSGAGDGIIFNEDGVTPPPPKRLSVLGRIGPKKQSNAKKAFSLVHNKSRADEVEKLLNQISNANGFALTKRLSISDNDIVQSMQKVIGNDPKVTSIKIDSDVRFNHLRSSLIQDFGDSIRQNLYLKSLTIRGVELGNTFLEALSSAIMDNVTLQEIDLSRNHLTHDAMVEFCQALEYNQTIKTVYLQSQLSPLYDKGTDKVLTSMEKNHSVRKMKIDFQDPGGQTRLKEILQRNYWNKDGFEKPDFDDLLVNFLKDEVVRAEEQFELKKQEKELEEVPEGDWDYLYELSVLFDTFKVQKDIDNDRGSQLVSYISPMHEARTGATKGIHRNPFTGAQGFPSDGSFLTEEFISDYLREDSEKGELVFDFCNQFRLFKQFPSTSPDRETIISCFVYELLHHPRQHEITGINMANTGCGSDFWVNLSEQVLEDPSLLPNVHLINSETNFLTEPGMVAIADMIQSKLSMRYIQTVRLDNQKALLSSQAERALARAICVNLSVVRFSLRIRNLLERDQINKYVCRNIDFLRQARQHHKKKSGITMERKRNTTEQLFDKIAANDDNITEVNISADMKFKGLSDREKVKCAEAFSTNTHVKSVTLNALDLGDDFASTLGEALMLNDTIEKICIEGNSISGPGFKGLFVGLGRNDSVLELRSKHQTKSMASPDEQELPALVERNKSITKFSMDLRNSAITMKLDRIGRRNREAKRMLTRRCSNEDSEETHEVSSDYAITVEPSEEVDEEDEGAEENEAAVEKERSDEVAEEDKAIVERASDEVAEDDAKESVKEETEFIEEVKVEEPIEASSEAVPETAQDERIGETETPQETEKERKMKAFLAKIKKRDSLK